MPNLTASPARTARLIHFALMGSVTMASLVLALLPAQTAPVSPLFLYAVFGVAAVLFAGALVISTRLPHEGNPAPDPWWSQNLPRAIMVWALLEGPSLLGAVAFMLTRNAATLIVPAIGLVLLVILGPSRLEQG
jgi:hypothetical protein